MIQIYIYIYLFIYLYLSVPCCVSNDEKELESVTMTTGQCIK